MIARVLAVLSAALLVGAVALGTLGPQEMTLGEALSTLDAARLGAAEDWVRGHVSGWLWDHPVSAFLVRPAWLVPAGIGLLLAGSAMSVASATKAPNSRRRRS